MQRANTLIKKLQEQFAANAPAHQLLLTVQMLQAELISHVQANAAPENKAGISVDITQNNIPGARPAKEKTIEVLQVDEAAIDAELEEIKRQADEIMKKLQVHNKPTMAYGAGEEEGIPTLAHQMPAAKKTTWQPGQQKEINETIAGNGTSLNDTLKQPKIDVGDTLTEAPIRDLKKAIGINDRFLYINELFRGDESMYERSIKTINNFSILPEAEYWIQRELKVKIGWNDNNETVKQFCQLVKRRFM
jgi:hypothetical protein